ncbi:MAG: LytTR family transcriptional regulator DNA-binding domain-containing protein [Clostridia bacterium]
MTEIKISGIRLQRRNDETDFAIFDMNDVNFVTSFKPTKNSERILLYHTDHGEYMGVNTLEGVKRLWERYGFVTLDSVNVVNLNNIAYVDEVNFRAYFHDGSFTTISRSKMELVKDLPRKTVR